MKPRKRRMTEKELIGVLDNEITSATGYVGDEVSESRRKALQFYNGEKFGNELEGRSSYVSQDVQDIVESILPDLMDIFASGDVVVEFEPVGEEDVAGAQQATDYVNFVVTKDNDGFLLFYDWMKDALLQKNGVVRCDWDDTPMKRRETLTKVNLLTVQELLQDEDVEILEQEETEPETEEEAFQGALFNLKLEKTYSRGKVKLQCLPPEEFLISRRAVSLDDAPFTCHKMQKTVSELLEMGYDQELIDSIPSHDEGDYNEERVQRFNQDEWPEGDDSLDPAQREVWIYDCFLKLDYDGDGMAELRNVVCGGPGYKILPDPETDDLAMEVDDHPFVDLTPIRMPHKFFGRSYFEIAQDIQLIKSTLIRMVLDNTYHINNARSAVSKKVNLDDYLSHRTGGVVRVDTDQGDVAAHMSPIVTQPIGQQLFPLIELMDGVRETRTGATRYNQGLDADSLNKTATGINLLLNQTQKRLLLVARLFAEGGYKKLFRKVLRLLVNHQDKARMIRLRNDWVPMDPRAWNSEMDLTVRVGLGHGTKETKVAGLMQLMGMVEKVVAYQGGVQGPLVTLKEVHELARQFTNAIGQKPARLFFREPSEDDIQAAAEQSKNKKDPKVMEVEAKIQADQMRVQADMQKAQQQGQLEREKQERELQFKVMEFQAEMQMKREEHELEMQIMREKAGLEMQVKQVQVAQKAQEAEAMSQVKVRTAEEQGTAKIDMMKKQAEANPKGNGAQT